MKVLLTGANTIAGSAMAGVLRMAGHAVLGVDGPAHATDLNDRGVSVPEVGEPGRVSALEALIHSRGIDAVIPTRCAELPTIALAAENELAHKPILIGPVLAVATVRDRWLMTKALKNSGISVPRSALPSHYPNLEAVLRSLGTPIVLRPRVSASGRSARVIRMAGDVNYASLDDSWFFQQYAGGLEYVPLAHIDGRDRDRVAVLHQRVPEGSDGAQVIWLSPLDAPDISSLALETAYALTLTGPVNFKIRRLPNGRAAVLDVEAHFGAHIGQAPELVAAALTSAHARAALRVMRSVRSRLRSA